MASVTSLCVFCGAADAVDKQYLDAATRLGTLMAQAGVRLVFGGGRIGLMGAISNAVAAGGGSVVGIIPTHLHNFEVGQRKSIGELHVVGSMHERKAKMFDLSDAIAILPGELGTLDETFEVMTWKQLGMHDKPIVICDVGGYWAPFLHQIDRIVDLGFAPESSRHLVRTVATPEEVLPLLASLPEPSPTPTHRFMTKP